MTAEDLLTQAWDEDRFWSKVLKRPGGCWEWTAARTHNGYGRFTLDRTSLRAHRVSYWLSNGPIPDGLLICHHCDNPGCVRPEHLFAATQKQNVRDAITKGRMAYGERHPRGRLNEVAVRVIRYFRGKKTQEELARAFGVSQPMISWVQRGICWK